MANVVNTQLFIDGAYVDKTAFTEEGIEVEVGPDVETGTRPNQVSLTWDNSDLSMDPSNVLGALFGKIGPEHADPGPGLRHHPDRGRGHAVGARQDDQPPGVARPRPVLD
jgi:hypothetical protein